MRATKSSAVLTMGLGRAYKKFKLIILLKAAKTRAPGVQFRRLQI